MMGKRSLSRTWCLVAMALFGAALALSFTGCGGSRSPRDAARPRLRVELAWRNSSGWDSGGGTSVVVEDPPGLCHVEQYWSDSGPEPFGNFEMMLTPAQLTELRAAVREAIRGLNAGYPPPEAPDPGDFLGEYYLHLTCGDAHGGVSGPDAYWAIPEPARPLYWLGQPPGLLNKLCEETLEHPLAAIALSATSDEVQYCCGEPIRLTLTVSSVGRDPVAFTPRSCREIVDGLITVTGQFANGERVLAETFAFGSSQRPEWEPFTPAARADLPLVRVLRPGETYAFRLPPLTPPRAPGGTLTVKVTLRVSPRYHLNRLRQLAGAVVATGEWEDSLDVVVWP